MKVAEITQWVALLASGKIDDGVARFGKKVTELAGRNLVTVAPTDQRFSSLMLEYDEKDDSRLLFLSVFFGAPEPVSHTQVEKRFGKSEPIMIPVDDFSGESPGTQFLFGEGKERFVLCLYFEGKIDESVDVSRATLRRLVPLEHALPKGGAGAPS